MSKYSKQIKQDILKDIVLKETECDEKLAEIRTLLGLPQSENVSGSEGGGVVTEETAVAAQDLRSESISRILEGFKGREAQLAKQLLIEIEKSSVIDWDDATLELILNNNKNYPSSNIRLLIEKLLYTSSPTLPNSFVSWIDALCSIKLPITYFRDSDSLNVRDAVLKIRQEESVVPEGNEAVVAGRKRDREPEDETELEETFVKRPRLSEEEKNSRKRSRVEEDESELATETVAKKSKISEENSESEINLTEPDPQQTGPRRSKRVQLKKKLGSTWRAFDKV